MRVQWSNYRQAAYPFEDDYAGHGNRSPKTQRKIAKAMRRYRRGDHRVVPEGLEGNWVFDRVLGTGTFGMVSQWSSEEGATLAMKQALKHPWLTVENDIMENLEDAGPHITHLIRVRCPSYSSMVFSHASLVHDWVQSDLRQLCQCWVCVPVVRAEGVCNFATFIRSDHSIVGVTFVLLVMDGGSCANSIANQGAAHNERRNYTYLIDGGTIEELISRRRKL